MTDQDNANGFKDLQQVFGMLEPLRTAWARNWVNYWQGQQKTLDSMEEFTRGWFQRRHDAVGAALHAAERSCVTCTPADVVHEFQAWTTGSIQRIAADGLACQKHMMAVAESAGANIELAEQATVQRPAARESTSDTPSHVKAA
jgi:hypothetical protein